MLNLKEFLLCLFFSSCVYAAIAVPAYRSEKRDKQSEPAQIFQLAVGITSTAAGVMTGIISMTAMLLLGTHGGYWLVAVVLTLIAGFILVKHIWEKILPETMGETRPISGFVYFLGVGAMEVGILMIFWIISLAVGIAVQYSCLPFKI